jgi:4-phytase/acid phosphatase
LCAAIFSAATTVGSVALAADYELVSAVVVSRHGVRSPIAGHPPPATFAADPWPSWPVPPGYLTPRGAELAKLLGGYYRQYYVSQGLFPAQGCPPTGAVLAWADVDQRTRVTAQSLLDGVFPGCGFAPASLSMQIDPLFHPTRAGVCQIDPARARQSVLRRAAGNLASLHRKFRAQIAAMQSALKCCQPALCRAAGASAPCSLRNLPSAIVAENNGTVRLSGPISIGSTASEVFLLAYAEGFPDQQIAWGRASTLQAIRPLLRLHTLEFDLMQRTPYLATRQGSALVEKIWSTLRRSVETNGADGRQLTLLVGHDTNLANIGGMLGLHWSLPSFLADETPPAGAMHFDLLRDRQTKGYAVRIRYVSQTLDQMRRVVPLDLVNPPETAVVKIARCKVGDGGACPWTDFTQIVDRALDRACIDSQRQGP